MTVVPATGVAGRAVDRLVLSTPDAFLASVPHMVGFDCADSVVLVGLGPNPADRTDRSGMVRLVQRFDTPPSGMATEDLASIARSAAEPMARSGSTEVIVAVFGATPAPGAELPSAGPGGRAARAGRRRRAGGARRVVHRWDVPLVLRLRQPELLPTRGTRDPGDDPDAGGRGVRRCRRRDGAVARGARRRDRPGPCPHRSSRGHRRRASATRRRARRVSRSGGTPPSITSPP